TAATTNNEVSGDSRDDGEPHVRLADVADPVVPAVPADLVVRGGGGVVAARTARRAFAGGAAIPRAAVDERAVEDRGVVTAGIAVGVDVGVKVVRAVVALGVRAADGVVVEVADVVVVLVGLGHRLLVDAVGDLVQRVRDVVLDLLPAVDEVTELVTDQFHHAGEHPGGERVRVELDLALGYAGVGTLGAHFVATRRRQDVDLGDPVPQRRGLRL